MEKKYEIRDENGILKAKISTDFAMKIHENTPGKFREIKLTDGTHKNIYEISEDTVFGDGKHLELFLWKGDSIRLSTPKVENTNKNKP